MAKLRNFGVRPCLIAYLLALRATLSATLRVDSTSKCASVCSPGNTTTTDEVVCYDNEFSSTASGQRYQKCVECELESTDVDVSSGTDVLWGIYNLRYAVSTCIYGYPEARTSLSTPCQVSCASLAPAVEYNINDTATADLGFCNQPAWADTIINNCVFCYNWTTSERYISNFLQALHNACKDPPQAGSTFPIAATQIFSTTQISAPPSTTASSSHKGLGNKLALVIALPVVFGTIILVTTIFCCTWLVCKRRRRMQASGNMDRFHAGAWGSPTVANAYGQHGAWPSPQWQKHSPGFAAHRNSGMGWAQPMSPNANKRNSFYDGWGNTFPPTAPHGLNQDDQLHERYFPAPTVRPDNWPHNEPPVDSSTLDFASTHSSDIKTPFPQPPTGGLNRRSSISKDPIPFYPDQQQTQPSSRPTSRNNKVPLNLQIPSPTAAHPTKEKQNPFSATSTATTMSPEEFRNFSPYHDLNSPEENANGSSPNKERKVKGQTFFFDEQQKIWRKEGDPI